MKQMIAKASKTKAVVPRNIIFLFLFLIPLIYSFINILQIDSHFHGLLFPSFASFFTMKKQMLESTPRKNDKNKNIRYGFVSYYSSND
jgi:hypothetical protein